MENTDLKSMFEQAQKDPARNLELTKDEAEKFRNAFDDPEFCKLMAEYVTELQDPSNRAETETYISQLEGENKVPEGKELIRPHTCFVAKTRKIDSGNEEKLFINIVSSEKIAPPTKTSSPEGQNWSLPYSLGPPHMEKDKSGEAVAAFDCCFHPDATRMSQQHKQFRDILVQTAISGIEEAFRRQQHREVTVRKDFRVLKGVVYKSGQVPSMLIDIAGKKKWDGEKNISDDKAPRETELSEPCNRTTSNESSLLGSTQIKEEPVIKKGFLNDTKKSIYPKSEHKPSKDSKRLIQEVTESDTHKGGVTHTKSSSMSALPPANLADTLVARDTRRIHREEDEDKTAAAVPVSEKEPKYSITERALVGMGDFGDNKSSPSVTSTRPAELICKIEIPKVSRASKVELIVGERDIKLAYLDVYELLVKLPYPVFDKKGTAKFDKIKKTLVLTLPVKPSEIVMNSPTPGDDQEAKPGVADEEENEEKEAAAPRNTSVRADPGSENKPKHGRWVSSSDEGGAEFDKGKVLREEVDKKAREAIERLSSVVPDELANISEDGDKCHRGDIDKDNEFLPAVCFVGKKDGYVFKRGDLGLGYYVDKLKRKTLAATPATSTEGEESSSSDGGATGTSSEIEFNFRQTEEAIALIVQVKNIVESTAVVQFSHRGVDMRFSVCSRDGNDKSYKIFETGFDVKGSIDSNLCKYDVATQNMVIILHKMTPGIWTSEDRSIPVLIQRPYSSQNLSKTILKEKDTIQHEDSHESPVDKKSHIVTSAMHFSVEGLLELD